MAELTRREFEVYMLAVTTATPERELAQELGIMCSTVTKHLQGIYDAMGVSNRLELMSQYWYRELHPAETA